VARRKAKVDSNQPEIVARFREHGCSVKHTHMVGSGFTDIVVGLLGVNLIVEIKDGNKSPSERRLTHDEQEFSDGWLGRYDIVEGVEDVDRLVAEIRKQKRHKQS